MGRYDIVSLDLFQTLVDVDSRQEHVWGPILKETYSKEAAARHGEMRLRKFFAHWERARDSREFVLMRPVFRDSLAEHFLENGITFDCEEALELLIQEHTNSQPYEETEDFLDRVTREYKVCILSDADDDMVPDINKRYRIDLFTSERLRSYKNDRNNTMFHAMLDTYQVEPSRVIHIGDSVSDVAGAHRAGVVSCWINRHGREWSHPVRPDFEIANLNELWPILQESDRVK
ncbi:HAD family hydrolase [Gorillibacterium sp. sgz5001074]|uniref:HAD family hydrolase n=1 Tax=Gorillibacterium sp. sgz5001074 TaxID=3446695 RepID=UPI003F66EEF1